MHARPAALMLMAAGFGTRMGALTADRPKAMIEVAGRPLIDHALALGDGAGIARKVVNLHWRPEPLARHLAGRADVALSYEAPEILDTAGGVRAALGLLGPGPVFVLNTDAVWTGENPLGTLARAWRPGMGALLCLAPLGAVRGRQAPGDFAFGPDGRIARKGPMVYLGAQIVDGAVLAALPEGPRPRGPGWDALIAEGRAFGCTHRGGWCDVGHPGGIAEAEALLAEEGASG
ncbi:MAG: nucleotidyltransferase family protein [Gemmobacter sp.]